MQYMLCLFHKPRRDLDLEIPWQADILFEVLAIQLPNSVVYSYCHAANAIAQQARCMTTESLSCRRSTADLANPDKYHVTLLCTLRCPELVDITNSVVM